jgi:hypothetical protein
MGRTWASRIALFVAGGILLAVRGSGASHLAASHQTSSTSSSGRGNGVPAGHCVPGSGGADLHRCSDYCCADGDGAVTVTILTSDVGFETQGCGTWTPSP